MQWKEMQALVCAPGEKVDEQLCVEAFPLLEGLKDAPGDPVYHGEGSTYIHTFLVMDVLVNDPQYALLGQTDRETVFFATLLHDIAKLRTTVLEGGRVSNPGHSAKGALDARIMLWEAGAPIAQREAICRMIVNHQIPFHAINGNRQGDSAEFIVRALSWQVDLHLLCMLARADILGRICPDVPAVLDNIELFRLLAQEEGCYRSPRSFASADTALRYFRGAQVHPDFALHESPGSEVIVVCGLPASGKNHWVARHHGSLPVVSYDDARTELGLLSPVDLFTTSGCE